MGYRDWLSFAADLERERRRVRAHFEGVLGEPEAPGENAAPEPGDEVWGRLADPSAARDALAALGFGDGAAACERLRTLRDNYRTRALGERGQRRIAALIGPLLREAAATADPPATLGRVLGVVESVLQRAAYLALLTERPIALGHLVRLCAASPWLTEHLAAHPQVFDELLDARTLYHPPGREALERALDARLANVDAGDSEREMDALRYFQQAAVLRVAAAEIAGAISLMVVSDRLTDIAEVCLARVLDFAWRDLTARHGEPRGSDEGAAPFAIIAYGKLGGIELGYGSDLDLVFIHGAAGDGGRTRGRQDGRGVLDTSTFFARLGQRIIHWLATYTPAGRLYEVDPRLRPSGSAGLLVTGFGAFAAYQRDEAWTWEHQALVRARAVAGDAGLGARFAALRREILLGPRDPDTLKREVREMRLRMQRELGGKPGEGFDVKQDPGGIADIEFLVQYGVLRWADRLGTTLRFTDNVRLLQGFAANGLLAAQDVTLLGDAYRAFRARVHELDLQGLETRIGPDELLDFRAGVRAIWGRWMDEKAEVEPASR